MQLPLSAILILGAYLLGSIPTAVWIGKYFFGIDVREYGSGNAGATNTFRVLGKKAGIPVLAIDVLKGFSAVSLAYFQTEWVPASSVFVIFQLCLAVFAVLGHMYPVFAGFRGGKGVATLLGIGIGLHPYATLICMAIFIVMLLLTNYVSVSSMTAGIAFPIILHLLFKNTVLPLSIFSYVVSVLLIYTHRQNIERLRKGTESKVKLFKKG